MPAKRLPWFKIESGATRHPKIAVLTDLQFRVWVELLDAASHQPTRGRFASIAEAAAVIRRPAKVIRSLMPSLVEVSDQGVLMHDWSDWQDRYPSEVERSTNTPLNSPPTLVEDSANAPPHAVPTLADHLHKRKREKRDIELNPSGGSPPSRNTAVIDALRAQDMDPTLSSRDHAEIKRTTADPSLIAEVYGAVYRGEYGDDFMRNHLSVHEAIGWIDGYRAWRAQGSPERTGPRALVTSTTGPPAEIEDNTGKGIWR